MQELITREQLASHLNVHPDTIDRMRKRKEIPSLQFGRQFRYDLEAVLKSAQEKARGASAG